MGDVDLEALRVCDNAAAKVSLVARPGLCEVQELTRAGAAPSLLSRVGAVLDSGDPGSISAVRSGRAAVQDEGSQLVALAMADATVSTGAEHEKWLDLCAGPGGKAALLATLGAQRGATLFANEISEHRTDLVRQTLDAAIDSGLEVMIGTGDGREVGEEEPGTYDRVVVDAPCPGLGAPRRARGSAAGAPCLRDRGYQAGRRHRLCDLQPAPGGDQVRRHRRRQEAPGCRDRRCPRPVPDRRRPPRRSSRRGALRPALAARPRNRCDVLRAPAQGCLTPTPKVWP